MTTGHIILGAVAALVLGLVRALISSLLAGEIRGLLGSFLMHRVRAAAKKLPHHLAPDCEDEWLEELRAITDRPIRALHFVWGLNRAARGIVEERGPEPVRESKVDITAGFAHRFGALADDTLDGLTRPFKEMPWKDILDARGVDLLKLVREQPEHYAARTELAILEMSAAELATVTRATELLELGVSTGLGKFRLLDALYADGNLERYIHMDPNENPLRESAERLSREYLGLHVQGIVGDFEQDLDRLPAACGPRIVACLNGTLGRYPPGSRRRLLRDFSGLMGAGDYLLLSVELSAQSAVLEAAYDDAKGVTAELNRNLLRVLNRELNARFKPEDFDHVALFDLEHEWIELRLRARREHTTVVADLDLPVHFDAGEEMRTAIITTFTLERLEGDLSAANLELVRWFADPNELCAVALCQAARPVSG